MIDLRKLADILQPPDHDAVRRGRSPIVDLGRQSVVPIIGVPETVGNNIATNESFQPQDRLLNRELFANAPTESGLAVPPDVSEVPIRTPFANPPEQSGLIAPPEPEPTPPRFALSPSMRTRAEIDRIEQKDYSKRPNPNYDPTKPATTRNSPGGDTNNKYVYGDDYDRSRGFKDFLRSAGLGALGGFIRGGVGGAIGGAAAGGVRGAIDPNTDNRMIDAMKLEGLYPQYQRQFETETARQKVEQDAAYNKARTQNIYDDNLRQQDELKRKITKDTAQIEYWGRKADQGDLKLANDEKLIELRDKWAESKNENDKRRLALTEKEMAYRNIRSKLDRESRERIAGWRESGLNRRQQLASEARQLLTQFQEAQRNNRAEEQRALQERLAEIRAEAQANP